jgi:hypothetical protein
MDQMFLPFSNILVQRRQASAELSKITANEQPVPWAAGSGTVARQGFWWAQKFIQVVLKCIDVSGESLVDGIV